MTRRALCVLSLVGLAACSGEPSQPSEPVGGPAFAIVDASDPGGRPDFGWRPPIGNTSLGGSFDATRSPTVRICILDVQNNTCTGPELPATSVPVVNSNYQYDWMVPVSSVTHYRIFIEEGTPAVILGYADVKTAATSKGLKPFNPADFVGVTDGSILPIKFRITNACANASCGDGFIDTNTGGTSYYTEDGETKGGITIAPTPGGGVVQVEIKPCAGNLPIPNPKFGSCLDVLVEEGGNEYDGIGVAFICDAEAAAIASGLSAARQGLVTLYRKHGTDPVEALPHADDDCPTVLAEGSVKGLLRALVHGNWKKAGQQLTGILAPKPLYARRLDAGAGGIVDGGFSLFQFALPAALYGSAFTAGGTGSGVAACSSPCPASLYSIDRGTGAATLIGPIGFDRVGAMDFHPTTGVLYATGQRPAPDNTPVLITINVITGAGTEVGPTGTTGVVADLSFKSDGTLFLYDANPPEHRLYTVNLGTGAATLLGPTGLNNTGGNGIGFDAADVLYHSTVDFSRTLDQTTGAASSPVASMNFPVGCGRIAATDRIETINVFYGAIKCAGDQLGTVDYTTGAVTLIGATVSGLDGLAFGAGSCDDCVILTSTLRLAATPKPLVLPKAKAARRSTQ